MLSHLFVCVYHMLAGGGVGMYSEYCKEAMTKGQPVLSLERAVLKRD